MSGIPPNVVEATPLPAREAANLREAGSFFSAGEFQMTLVILFFGLVSIVAFYLLARHERATPYVLRILVIIVIVFGTLLVVSSAYSTQQIAPVVGLFGTIAGYLLGKSEKSDAGPR